MAATDIESLIQLLAKLPGLGPRSARRAALHLIKQKEGLMAPLARAMEQAAERITKCSRCGNFDTQDPCALCADEKRDASLICVVEEVADLWALERTASFGGFYHVLGGVLSPLDGIGPEDLDIAGLIARAGSGEVKEIIMATGATVDGKTTAHYITDRLSGCGVTI